MTRLALITLLVGAALARADEVPAPADRPPVAPSDAAPATDATPADAAPATDATPGDGPSDGSTHAAAPTPDVVPTPLDEPTAADVAGAPAAGAESGRVDTPDERDGAGRLIARGLLFVPRVAVTVVFAPVEGTAWAVERYQLIERTRRLFFNDAGTFGVFPTFELEAGFGLNLGARLVHSNLFGRREHLDVRASGGGRSRERYLLELTTGERLGRRVGVELGAEYEKRPKDVFWGLGNADEVAMPEPIDPTAMDAAAESRFRHRIMRVRGAFDVRVVRALHVRGAGAVADHTFDGSDSGRPIDEVFVTDRLAGYRGARNAYGELELRWDNRGAHAREPASVISNGRLIAAYAGRMTALDDGRDYWRYGLDVQQFFRIGPGPRVIALRSHAEGVTGPRDAVPFHDLPRLGGKTVLRGYPLDRFRDRVALVSSLDYSWDLASNLSASLFADVGRVHHALDELERDGMRVGYGMSIELHTQRSFLARASLASSIDGGVFFNFALDPVFELDQRVERR